MTPSLPDVSIVVCTWNRAALLERTLARFASLRAVGIDWELLIVDNNSDDDTANVVRRWSGRLPLRYIFEPQQGLSRARNRAMAEARGSLLLFTDDDVFLDAEWLAAFWAAAKRHPRAGVFGGPVTAVFEKAPDPDIAAAYPPVRAGLCGVDFGTDERILPEDDFVVGANFGFRRCAVRGLAFDVSLGSQGSIPAGGEEVKLQQAVREYGWDVVWIPAMRVQHFVTAERVTVSYLRRFVYHRARSSVHVSPLPGSRGFWRAPRWLWAHWARSGYALLRSALSFSRASRLGALYEFDRACGLLRGSIEQHAATGTDRRQHAASLLQFPDRRKIKDRRAFNRGGRQWQGPVDTVRSA